jgi:hypothetical protein
LQGVRASSAIGAPVTTTRRRHFRHRGTGSVTIRYRGKIHHLGVGRAHAGWRVVLLVAGRDIHILGADGSPLRHLLLDPERDYQRMP